MVDLAEVMTGPARDWLAAQRQVLNGRFRQAQRRSPQLHSEAALALLRELLPPMAGNGEEGSAALLDALFDLVLLHAGRGTLAPDGGGSLPGIAVLLRETFPRLRRWLLAQPRSLPGALSNAVENLGSRGPQFARDIASIGENLSEVGQVVEAGIVLAWRLGDARCRNKALELAARLPAGAVLAAFGLSSWPERAAPLVVAGQAADGWRRPENLFTKETLDNLGRKRPSGIKAVTEGVAALASEPIESWALVGRLGNFIGFDGHFEEPPLLLDAGPKGNRHRYWVRSRDMTFQLDGDIFGWSCRPDPSVDFPVRDHQAALGKHPSLTGATSAVAGDDVLAFTLADSFRIRVLAPPRRPV